MPKDDPPPIGGYSAPRNWYWIADDGRIFGSAAETIVDDTDQGYKDFLAAGKLATPWPKDDAGNQTDAVLQSVLTPYNKFVNLTYYTANARYLRAGGGVTVTSLSSVPFLTDPTNRNIVNSAWNYSTSQTGTWSVQWKMQDGSFVLLSKAQMQTLALDMSNYVEKCFACEHDTVAAISAGTITTRQQVDNAFAAISNVYP